MVFHMFEKQIIVKFRRAVKSTRKYTLSHFSKKRMPMLEISGIRTVVYGFPEKTIVL